MDEKEEIKRQTNGGYQFYNPERKVVVQFSDRDCTNKVCRVLYRIFDVFYQAFWYYYAPLVVFFLSFGVPYALGGYDQDSDSAIVVDE